MTSKVIILYQLHQEDNSWLDISGSHIQICHKHRKADGKWINVFNALFWVLNEKGPVIKWRFTKSTKAEETEILFRELSYRLRAQSKQIQAIYVDNRCQIWKKLRAFFNDLHLQVKLDLFHAINRFLVTIPKRWSWKKKMGGHEIRKKAGT